MIDCKADATQPNIKYEPTQLYYGTYQPSQDILFYNDNNTTLRDIALGFVINDSNYTSDEWAFELSAVDSGKVIKRSIIIL